MTAPLLSERLARFARASTALSLLSDEALSRRVEAAEPLAGGVGGTTLALDIDGVSVFAKRLRLTDLERRPEHRMSTANLFGLPTYCQRNVGSVGFGVWREWAAHVMTTGWALSGRLACFPLMFHWRALEGAAAANAAPWPAELQDTEHHVAYWGGSAAMRERLGALARASASIVIFMERLPFTLSGWLDDQWTAGPDAATLACEMVERALTVDVPTMNALGLLHGDAHFGNMLTDGHRVYLADFGLATSDRFALSAEERHYLLDHATLDRAYAVSKWVQHLVKAFAPVAWSLQDRTSLVRDASQGKAWRARIPAMPPCAAAIVDRHARVATLVGDFYADLHGERRDAPYPREAIEALLPVTGTPLTSR